jgi:hypothetical protein
MDADLSGDNSHYESASSSGYVTASEGGGTSESSGSVTPNLWERALGVWAYQGPAAQFDNVLGKWAGFAGFSRVVQERLRAVQSNAKEASTNLLAEAKRNDALKGASTVTEHDAVPIASEGAMRESYANYATSSIPIPIRDNGASTSVSSHSTTAAELMRGYASTNPESNGLGHVPTGYSGYWETDKWKGDSNITYPEIYGTSSRAPQVQERHASHRQVNALLLTSLLVACIY